MASPNSVSLGFLFLILTLSYGSGSARKLISDDIMLTENNELERRLGQESIPTASVPKSPDFVSTDGSPGDEPTSFGGKQVACGHPSCGPQIPGPNCQNGCLSCGCGQAYPQPQPAYPQPQPSYPQPQPAYPQPQPSYPQPPQPAYPQPQPSYPQPQPAYPQPQPSYPQPQPAYPPQASAGCQPAYPPQPEPNYPPWPEPAYPPQPEPAYPPQPEPTYPPWPEPAYPPQPEPSYPPQPEPAYPPQSRPVYPPPMTGPRLTSESPGSLTHEPSCTNLGCKPSSGLITRSPMTIEDQIDTRGTGKGGSMNEQVVSDTESANGS
ncbi:proteoglycan 4-like [Cynara cardunculus var. scolymus]|uniref:proteoglycan 4-like n=1 Tax=Cynara cardunculus var. scolymus TaxID=59895 RepID=UPI000D62FC49|nr:proteoglycan 4-like [Cynara cardunculus var. scolymus]